MPNNMKKHCNLLLNYAHSLFRYKAPISKKVTKRKKELWSSLSWIGTLHLWSSKWLARSASYAAQHQS
jgi:hypothetical protein